MTEVTLPRRAQIRNVALYALLFWLVYLTAPVLYVGITQATVCKALGASDTVSNLPTTAYFWAVIVPVVVAARFQRPSATAPVLVTSCAVMAAAGALVAATLWWEMPAALRIGAVIIYGGLIGIGLGLRNVFIWEVVNRGISHQLRGWAYGLAYGVGPLFAVIGSLAAQLLLSGEISLPVLSRSTGVSMASLRITPLEFPLNFVAVFGATVPLLSLATIVSSQFVLPPTDNGTPGAAVLSSLRQTVSDLTRDRILLFAILAYVLVDSGFTIANNMALYTPEALHKLAEGEVLRHPAEDEALRHHAEDYAGYQHALRFTGKMTVGLILGWLLVRTNAKMGMLITGALCLSGILGALLISGTWYLLSFALIGGGELYGVYYPNYMMVRSHPDRLRRNMAMLQLLSLATSAAPAGFGAISDAFGLPASFVAAACVVCGSLALVIFGLPARPTPQLEG